MHSMRARVARARRRLNVLENDLRAQKIIVLLRTDPLTKLYDIRVNFESLIWSGGLSSPKTGSRIVLNVVYPQYARRARARISVQQLACMLQS